jgi:hypothetical protein
MPMSVDIKPATIKDAENLSVLGAKTFIDTYSQHNLPEDMDQFLSKSFSKEIQAGEIADKKRKIFIAWLEGKVIGYFHLHESTSDNSVTGRTPIELFRFYVDSHIFLLGNDPQIDIIMERNIS